MGCDDRLYKSNTAKGIDNKYGSLDNYPQLTDHYLQWKKQFEKDIKTKSTVIEDYPGHGSNLLDLYDIAQDP